MIGRARKWIASLAQMPADWHQQRCGVNPPPAVPKPVNPPPAQQPQATIADRIHDGVFATGQAEMVLFDALQAEAICPDFELGSDQYDNSLEVYFREEIDRPWEPSWATRCAMLALGFDTVYWNFMDGTEVRGREPRRLKAGPHRHVPGVGYVDDTWTEDWIGGPYDWRVAR